MESDLSGRCLMFTSRSNIANILRALTYDPIIGSCDLIEQTIAACSFVKANNIILNLNQSFLNDLRRSVRNAVMHR